MNKARKLIILIMLSLTTFFIYNKTNKNNINYLVIDDMTFNDNDFNYNKYLKNYLIRNKKLKYYTSKFSYKYMTINDLYKDILINKEISINKKKINLKRSLRETDILLLSIGNNDILYRLSIINELNKKEADNVINDILKDYETLIDEIRKYYKKNIYVIGFYNYNYFDNYANNIIISLNKKLKQNKNIIFIDIKNILDKEKYYNKSNDNSLNFEGNIKIGQILVENIENDLKNS